MQKKIDQAGKPVAKGPRRRPRGYVLIEVTIGGIIAAAALTGVTLQLMKAKNEVSYAAKESAAREVVRGALEYAQSRGYNWVLTYDGASISNTDLNVTVPFGVTLAVAASCGTFDATAAPLSWSAGVDHCTVTATGSYQKRGTTKSISSATTIVEVP